ncbi:hypothetical protein HDU99_006246, partial [Rhizoclosmatium hyalinum]
TDQKGKTLETVKVSSILFSTHKVNAGFCGTLPFETKVPTFFDAKVSYFVDEIVADPEVVDNLVHHSNTISQHLNRTPSFPPHVE